MGSDFCSKVAGNPQMVHKLTSILENIQNDLNLIDQFIFIQKDQMHNV